MFASFALTLLVGSGLQADAQRFDRSTFMSSGDRETSPKAPKLKVVSGEYDPDDTETVQAEWLHHIGLPDKSGDENSGLLLSKNAKTTTNSAAGAEVKGASGITLTELGYDIRNGGHCGAGAPRFNVVTKDGVNHFVGCNSPPPAIETAPTTVDGAASGWRRLRWTAAQLAAAFPPIVPGSNVVKSISIVFDEGVDTGPDFSGMAIIDNIDVNGTLVGQQ
jgi:hypothetical protein